MLPSQEAELATIGDFGLPGKAPSQYRVQGNEDDHAPRTSPLADYLRRSAGSIRWDDGVLPACYEEHVVVAALEPSSRPRAAPQGPLHPRRGGNRSGTVPRHAHRAPVVIPGRDEISGEPLIGVVPLALAGIPAQGPDGDCERKCEEQQGRREPQPGTPANRYRRPPP